MSDESGTLSIDFLVGFTIFLIAFIWVISIIPGLLIGLQAFTIDYDAVAYRTGVILVEDPGEPSSWEVAPYNENYDKTDVSRFGLAVSRDDPNILSQDKVNRFFDTATFDYPDDYHNRSIFGDYPYRFNISLMQIGDTGSTRYIGDVLPEGYGYIRRFVKIKSMSYATIDAGTTNEYTNGKNTPADGNETTHIFSILLNNTHLVGKTSPVKDPAYQIIPGRESFMINLTNLSSTMWPDRESCFNISLNNIIVTDGTQTIPFNDPVIDDVPIHIVNSQTVKNNVSILYNITDNRKGINWQESQIYIYLTFNLVPTNNGCACPPTKCQGSRFLNNTIITAPTKTPFDYNYDPKNVTQPQLMDAVAEVAIW